MWKILPFFVALFVVGLVASIPGGIQDVAFNDQGFLNAKQYALDYWNRNSQDEYMYNVDSVIKAQSQVVQGMKYIMTLKMRKTFCLKQRNTGFCPMITNPNYSKIIYCTFTVLEFNGFTLLEFRCQQNNPWG